MLGRVQLPDWKVWVLGVVPVVVGFRDHLLDDLPIQELLPHFDDRLGRPSKDLHTVIGVLLLRANCMT